jgi:hypothetical protein
MPSLTDPMTRAHEYQMYVYSELYRQQTGVYPDQCAIVFVNELGDDQGWDKAGIVRDRFPNLIYTIRPDPKYIRLAMGDFAQTVSEIDLEHLKPYAIQWQAPEEPPVDRGTCKAYELRHNCPSYPAGLLNRSRALCRRV